MRRIAGCALILAVYMVWRAFIYSVAADAGWGWYTRDMQMTLPRLVCFSSAIALGLRAWGRRGLGFTIDGLREAIVIGPCLLFILGIGALAQGPRSYPVSLNFWLFFAFASLIVGLYEEVLFRGACLNALRDVWGERVGIIGSSLAFVVFHVQAQPMAVWPFIFMFGLITATLRSNGVSLWWLILIHWIVDTLSPIGFNYQGRLGVVSVSQASLLVLVYAGYRRWLQRHAAVPVATQTT